jgi:hypothetical protein
LLQKYMDSRKNQCFSSININRIRINRFIDL